MAFGVKYRGEFTDDRDIDWRIDILEDGFVGGVTDITLAGTPINIKWGKSGTFKYDAIKASEAIVNIQIDTNYDLRDLITSDEDQFIVKVYRGAALNLFWQGFMMPDIYDEDFIDPPYTIAVKFTDGLNRLKNIDYADAYGAALEGQTDIISVIVTCLDFLNNTFDIRENVNIYEDSMNQAAADSPLDQTFVYQERFYKLKKEEGDEVKEPGNCLDVLEAVLNIFGARLWFQWVESTANPAWFISQVNELDGGSFDQRVYDSTGSFIGNNPNINFNETISTTVNKANILFLNADQKIEFEPVYKKLVVSFDPGELIFPNIIPDGSIDVWDNATTPTFWTGSAQSNGFVSRKFSLPGYTRNLDGSTNHFSAEITNDAVDTGLYIESNAVNLSQSGNDIQLQLVAAVYNKDNRVSNFSNAVAVIRPKVRIAILNNGKFLNYDDPAAPFFQVAENIIELEMPTTGGFTSVIPYSLRFTLDANGDFQMRLYQNLHWTVTYLVNGTTTTYTDLLSSVVFDRISARLIVNNDAGSEIVTINNELSNNSSIDVTEFTVKFGDLVVGLNTGSLTLTGGVLTSQWRTAGATEDIELLQLLSDLILKNFSSPTRLLRGTIWGAADVYPNKVLKFSEGATDVYYTYNNMNFDIKQARWSGEWFENLGNPVVSTTKTKVDEKLFVSGDGIGSLGTQITPDIRIDQGQQAGQLNFDSSDGNQIAITMTGDATINLADNAYSSMIIEVEQDGTGGRTLTLGERLREQYSGQLTIDTDPGKKTLLTFLKSPSGGYVLTEILTNFIGDEILLNKTTLTSAQVLLLNGTPITLVAAPGAGLAILPLNVVVFIDFNTAAYATNTTLVFDSGPSANTRLYEAAILDSVNDTFILATRTNGADESDQIVTNAIFQVTVAGGNPTAGDSPVTIWTIYKLIKT